MLATERCLFSVEKEAFIKVFLYYKRERRMGVDGGVGGWTDRWVG